MSGPERTPGAALASGLTDAMALRKFSKITRDLIRRKGFVRCLDHKNAWHPEVPPPGDFGNGKEAHFKPCDCRVRK